MVPDSMRVMVAVQMVSDTVGYSAGAYNLSVFETGSGINQSQYQNINPVLRKKYEQIGMYFYGQENYRGYFVETTDGGLSWHPKGIFEDSVYYLVGISFIDQQTGFVIASSQGVSSHAILKTTDGGNTWNFVYPFEEFLWIEDIEFFNNLKGIAVGEEINGSDGGVVLLTTNSGENWNKIYVNDLNSIVSITYLDVNNVLIGGINSSLVPAIFKSTDGGSNWQEFHISDSSGFLEGVDAVQNSGVILIYGTNFSSTIIPFVDISIDGGISWNYSQLFQYRDYIPLYSKMINEERWYISGTQNAQAGFVLFTDNSAGVPVELVSFIADFQQGKVHLKWITATELNNSGFEIERKSENTNWRRIGFKDGKGTTTEIQNYLFIDDLFGVEPGRLYYRLKQLDYNGTYEYSDVVEVISSPTQFSLGQNYPNPFNPTTKIKFTIPFVETGHAPSVQLIVYDMLGNEVATLVNEEKPADSHEVEFDGKELPSGVYFYLLTAGTYSATKKMILLK